MAAFAAAIDTFCPANFGRDVTYHVAGGGTKLLIQTSPPAPIPAPFT